jgi:hypothetical protein
LLKLAGKGFVGTDSQPIWYLQDYIISSRTQQWGTIKARPEWLVSEYLQKETVQKQGESYKNGNTVMLGMVAHTYNPSDWDAKTGESWVKASLATQWVLGQSKLYEILYAN